MSLESPFLYMLCILLQLTFQKSSFLVSVSFPALSLSFISSSPVAHHSDRAISSALSEITIPQLLQIISQDSESVTILLPFLHTGHAIEVFIIRLLLCLT